MDCGTITRKNCAVKALDLLSPDRERTNCVYALRTVFNCWNIILLLTAFSSRKCRIFCKCSVVTSFYNLIFMWVLDVVFSIFCLVQINYNICGII